MGPNLDNFLTKIYFLNKTYQKKTHKVCVCACVCVCVGGGIDRKFPRKLSLEVSMNFSLELSRKLPIEIIGTYQISSKNQPHFQLWLVFLKFSETFWNFVKLFHETFSGNFKPFQNLGNFLSIQAIGINHLRTIASPGNDEK